MKIKAKTIIYKPTGEFATIMDDGEIGTSSIPHMIFPETATLEGIIRFSIIRNPELIELVDIDIKI